MPTFHEEVERRTAEFTYYLEMMSARRRGLEKGNGFIIFEERTDADSSDEPDLSESKALVFESAIQSGGWADDLGDRQELDEAPIIDLPEEGFALAIDSDGGSSSSALIPNTST